jgi:hypothetical protein
MFRNRAFTHGSDKVGVSSSFDQRNSHFLEAIPSDAYKSQLCSEVFEILTHTAINKDNRALGYIHHTANLVDDKRLKTLVILWERGAERELQVC